MNIYIRQEHSVPPAMSYNSSWEEVITYLQIQYIYVALAPIGLISVCLYKSYGRIKPKQTNINHTSYQNIFSLALQTSNNYIDYSGQSMSEYCTLALYDPCEMHEG